MTRTVITDWLLVLCFACTFGFVSCDIVTAQCSNKCKIRKQFVADISGIDQWEMLYEDCEYCVGALSLCKDGADVKCVEDPMTTQEFKAMKTCSLVCTLNVKGVAEAKGCAETDGKYYELDKLWYCQQGSEKPGS